MPCVDHCPHAGPLRLRCIRPSLLNERITSGELVAIPDLLDFEDEPGVRARNSRVVRMSPSRLPCRPRVIIPEGLEMVLYCTSSGALTGEPAAAALKKKGVSNVWVFEGGLRAWRREGFPVTLPLSTSNETAERFGIRGIVNRPGATT